MPRAKSICPKPGCPKIKDGRRYCKAHDREADRARGTRQQRGYGYAHQQQRKVWAERINTGTVTCSRCGLPLMPWDDWHLDHDDDDRAKYRGPSHAACNTSAGGQAAHRYR